MEKNIGVFSFEIGIQYITQFTMRGVKSASIKKERIAALFLMIIFSKKLSYLLYQKHF